MILLTYASKYGSTAEIAKALADSMRSQDLEVEVKPIAEVENLDIYDAVVVGGPMILGWHRDVMKFLQQHQAILSQMPVAYFVVCVSLTRTSDGNVQGVPLYLDPELGKPPQVEGKLKFREKHTTVDKYIGPALEKMPEIKPLIIAFFGGVIDNSKLNFFAKLFVRFIGAKEGDYRNWDAIRDWGTKLVTVLQSSG